MSPEGAYIAIDAAARPHLHGHLCTDGHWYNAGAGRRIKCPTLRHLETARAEVAGLAAQVHEAAHDREAVWATMSGLLAGTDPDDLDHDQRLGWATMVEQAIEALAAHLDPSTRQEAPDDHA